MGAPQLQSNHKLKLTLRCSRQENTRIQATTYEHPVRYLPLPHHQGDEPIGPQKSSAQDSYVCRKSCACLHHRQTHHKTGQLSGRSCK